ncbi:MAG TPA: patatin-like phospholipase family protein [Candidatus Acidoferrum sp.]|nr:patatin-like phospholipase family protein [Candidatus Acidoferrum sp.]
MFDTCVSIDRKRFLGGFAAATIAAAPRAAQSATTRAGPARRALVLTGGGARGAYQAGAIQGLHDRGERFDLICGTSIGAVNGALLAQGDLDILTELWGSIAQLRPLRPIPTAQPFLRSIAEVRDAWRGVLSRPLNVMSGMGTLWDHGRIFGRTGFLEPEPVAAYLRAVLTLDRLRTPFAWAATNLTSARAEAFYVDSDPPEIPQSAQYRFHRLDPQAEDDRRIFPETIRASTSVPLAFPPVPLTLPGSGVTGDYVDGGVALNAPIALARQLGATDIVAIGVDPPRKPHRVEGLLDVVFGTLDANQTTLIFSQLADGAFPPLRSVGIVRPSTDPAIQAFDFNRQAEIDAAFAQGRTDGRAGPVSVPFDDPAALERLIEGGAA